MNILLRDRPAMCHYSYIWLHLVGRSSMGPVSVLPSRDTSPCGFCCLPKVHCHPLVASAFQSTTTALPPPSTPAAVLGNYPNHPHYLLRISRLFRQLVSIRGWSLQKWRASVRASPHYMGKIKLRRSGERARDSSRGSGCWTAARAYF